MDPYTLIYRYSIQILKKRFLIIYELFKYISSNKITQMILYNTYFKLFPLICWLFLVQMWINKKNSTTKPQITS